MFLFFLQKNQKIKWIFYSAQSTQSQHKINHASVLPYCGFIANEVRDLFSRCLNFMFCYLRQSASMHRLDLWHIWVQRPPTKPFSMTTGTYPLIFGKSLVVFQRLDLLKKRQFTTIEQIIICITLKITKITEHKEFKTWVMVNFNLTLKGDVKPLL